MARQRAAATIVDLTLERARRRLTAYEARILKVLEENRGALSSLFNSGAIFTRRGSRLGRDLLLAHQHLLRVKDVLAKLVRMSEPLRRAASPEVEMLYGELDALLEKTAALTLKTSARSQSRIE